MKKKWDWDRLKADFLVSEFDDVKSFLDQLDINYTSINWKYFKWWAKEKQEFKQKVINQALEDAAKKKAKDIELDIDDLKFLESWVVKVAKQKLIKHSKWKKVDTRLKEIWDIAREGLGKKDEKENEKFEPFNNYMIVNVWEAKDNNS